MTGLRTEPTVSEVDKLKIDEMIEEFMNAFTDFAMALYDEGIDIEDLEHGDEGSSDSSRD